MQVIRTGPNLNDNRVISANSMINERASDPALLSLPLLSSSFTFCLAKSKNNRERWKKKVRHTQSSSSINLRKLNFQYDAGSWRLILQIRAKKPYNDWMEHTDSIDSCAVVADYLSLFLIFLLDSSSRMSLLLLLLLFSWFTHAADECFGCQQRKLLEITIDQFHVAFSCIGWFHYRDRKLEKNILRQA